MGNSPSNRTLAQFSLCRNNKEYTLREIVKNFDDLQQVTDTQAHIRTSNQTLLTQSPSSRNPGFEQTSQTEAVPFVAAKRPPKLHIEAALT